MRGDHLPSLPTVNLAPTPRWPCDMAPIRWIEDLPASMRRACWEYLAGERGAPVTLPLADAALEPFPGPSARPCHIDGRAYGVVRRRGMRYLIHASAPDQVHAGPVGQLTFPAYDALQALGDAIGRRFAGPAGLKLLRRLYASCAGTASGAATVDGCVACTATPVLPPAAPLLSCTRCGTLFRPPGHRDWGQLYADPSGSYFRGAHQNVGGDGHGYEDYEEWARVILGQEHFDARVRWVQMVTGRHGGKTLDVGCATGQMVAAFARGGWRARGLDLSPYCVARAAQLHPGSSFATGTVGDDDGPRVHVVTYLDVFEHVPDPVTELRTVRDVLEPGGWLVLELPNQHSADAYVLGADYTFSEHLFFYGPRQIVALLEGNGFTVVGLTTAHDSYFRIDRLVGADQAGRFLADLRGERLLVAARRS